ncbi:transmembrane invasion-related two-component sensor protein [Caballeronia novacaledonica]|uniref:Sensor protein n=1 Tax=Caballeronia novacaledonica TaxID=1544861 RepID=A0A2U3I200_9BURK|nr:heavy metal sensor histidine kinase [Caballeronia novacaledonica]SPB14120.1 transmembrane invasion-related two-component sensor protein [Caballeronia novacaledonica]
MFKLRLPRTLSTRLTLLIAATNSIILALSGFALYQALHTRVDTSTNRELAVTLASVRTHLKEMRGLVDVMQGEGIWLDQLHGHSNMDLALFASSGEMLFASPGFSVGAWNQDTKTPRSLVAFNGLTLRFIASDSTLAGDIKASVRVVLQYNATADVDLLRAYAIMIIVIEILGVMLAAGLAYGTALLALKPLRQLVRQAEDMSASRLALPLPAPDTASELRELAHAFNGMLARLDESFKRISQFSANLAHDMRTPLTNLLAEAQVVLSAPRSPEIYREVIESSVDEYRRLSMMIDDMLFLARSEHGRDSLVIRTLDALVEVHKVLGYYEAIAEEAGIILQVIGAGTVQADRMMLQRALSNLISNALKHAPAQSVVTVACSRNADGTTIAVSDRGAGIAATETERIFERFYRVDQARHYSTPGAGLGLAIVRSIMANHSGQCSVTSDPHVLTTFSLRFPARAV